MKLPPLSFGLRVGNMTVLSVSLFDLDEDEAEPAQHVSINSLDFGFAAPSEPRLDVDELEEEIIEVP